LKRKLRKEGREGFKIRDISSSIGLRSASTRDFERGQKKILDE